MELDLPFPVMLLDEAAAASARQRAAYNAEQVGRAGGAPRGARAAAGRVLPLAATCPVRTPPHACP